MCDKCSLPPKPPVRSVSYKRPDFVNPPQNGVGSERECLKKTEKFNNVVMTVPTINSKKSVIKSGIRSFFPLKVIVYMLSVFVLIGSTIFLLYYLSSNKCNINVSCRYATVEVNGVVYSSGDVFSVKKGDTIKVKSLPQSGFIVSQVFLDDVVVPENESLSINKNATLSIIAKKIHNLNLLTDNNATLKVTREGEVLSDDTQVYFGDVIKINAIANDGYTINRLLINGTPYQNDVEFVVNSNLTISVTTKKNYYINTVGEHIRFEILRADNILSLDEPVFSGEKLKINAVVDDGYNLVSFMVNNQIKTIGDNIIVGESNVEIFADTTAKSLTSAFVVDKANLFVYKNGQPFDPFNDTFYYNDEIYIDAVPYVGYEITSININNIGYGNGLRIIMRCDFVVSVTTVKIIPTALDKNYLSKLGVEDKSSVYSVNFYDEMQDFDERIVELSEMGNNSVFGCVLKNKDESFLDIHIYSFDKIKLPKNSSGLFSIFEYKSNEVVSNLHSVKGLNNLNTDDVSDMSELFKNCTNLTSIDFTAFDAKNVNNAKEMFSGCKNLQNIDLCDLNLVNVTDTEGMFEGCESLTFINFSNCDTSNIENFSKMFMNCKNLMSIDLSNFTTSNAIDFSYMFSGCANVETLDFSTFDTKNVINMSYMFSGCASLSILNLSSFETKNVVDMSGMFAGLINIQSIIQNFDTHNVTLMDSMFYGCKNIARLDLSGFDTQNVLSYQNMFSSCTGLTSLDLSMFNTLKAKNMSNMFKNLLNCEVIYVDDLNGWNVSSVVDSDNMFRNCVKIRNFNSLHTDSKSASVDAENGYLTPHRFKDGLSIVINNTGAVVELVSTDVNAKIDVNSRLSYGEKVRINISTDSDKQLKTLKVYGVDFVNGGVVYVVNDLIIEVVAKTKQGVLDCDFANLVGITDKSLVGSVNFDLVEDISAYSGVDVTKERNSTIIAYTKTSVQNSSLLDLHIVAEEKIKLPKICEYMFSFCKTDEDFKCVSNLLSVNNLDNLDASDVTNINGLFFGDKKIENVDLSIFADSKLVSMQGAFSNCEKLTYIDLSVLDASLVLDSSSLFAGCVSLNNVNFKGVDFSKVITTTKMFSHCKSLIKVDFEGMDFSEVLDASYMFYNCDKLRTINLNNCVVNSLVKARAMFAGCSYLESLDLSKFNTEFVIDMSEMFSGCISLLNLKIDNFNTSSVLDMSKMFSGLKNLRELNVGSFNTKNVDNMSEMFSECSELNRLDLSNFNTNKVQDFSKMFRDCSELKQINIDNFEFTNAVNMRSMFEGCTSLSSLSIGKNDTHNVTNMEALFKDCNNLQYLNVSRLDTQNVTNFKWMFSGLSLKTIDLLAMSTINGVNLFGMFASSNFKVLDLSSFDTLNVVDMSQMFMNAKNLNIVYVDKLWKTDSVKYSNSMFKNVNLRNASNDRDDVKYANVSETGYLTPIEAKNGYSLYFDDEADYEIIDTKTNKNILSGDKINFDDRLVVNFTQKANTRIDSVTLNNTPITSGQRIWVDRNVAISTALINSYVLSIQSEFAKVTIVNQFGESLDDKCVVFEDDILSIKTLAQRGYCISSLNINGKTIVDTVYNTIVHSDIFVCVETDTLQGTLSQDYLIRLEVYRKSQVKTINFCENNTDTSLEMIDISQERNWSVRGYKKVNDIGYDIFIESGKKIYLPSDCTRLFSCVERKSSIDISCLSAINGLTHVDTTRVTNMYEMLAYNFNLKYLDISGFDIKNVDNTDRMFYNCYRLTVDVSRFN